MPVSATFEPRQAPTKPSAESAEDARRRKLGLTTPRSPTPGRHSPDLAPHKSSDDVSATPTPVADPAEGFKQTGDYFAHVSAPSSALDLWGRYLLPQAKYIGNQRLGTSLYNVFVEFKTVDLANSCVTGFLRIRGLISDQDMITCFKGEIINNPLARLAGLLLEHQYSFVTENPQWGSFFDNDIEHWKYHMLDPCQETHGHHTDAEVVERLRRIGAGDDLGHNVIYMRWKEQFLVPDSRVPLLLGATFDGFYYVALNLGGDGRTAGSVLGLYYHKALEKFQTLTLKYAGGGDDQLFEFV